MSGANKIKLDIKATNDTKAENNAPLVIETAKAPDTKVERASIKTRSINKPDGKTRVVEQYTHSRPALHTHRAPTLASKMKQKGPIKSAEAPTVKVFRDPKASNVKNDVAGKAGAKVLGALMHLDVNKADVNNSSAPKDLVADGQRAAGKVGAVAPGGLKPVTNVAIKKTTDVALDLANHVVIDKMNDVSNGKGGDVDTVKADVGDHKFKEVDTDNKTTAMAADVTNDMATEIGTEKAVHMGNKTTDVANDKTKNTDIDNDKTTELEANKPTHVADGTTPDEVDTNKVSDVVNDNHLDVATQVPTDIVTDTAAPCTQASSAATVPSPSQVLWAHAAEDTASVIDKAQPSVTPLCGNPNDAANNIQLAKDMITNVPTSAGNVHPVGGVSTWTVSHATEVSVTAQETKSQLVPQTDRYQNIAITALMGSDAVPHEVASEPTAAGTTVAVGVKAEPSSFASIAAASDLLGKDTKHDAISAPTATSQASLHNVDVIPPAPAPEPISSNADANPDTPDAQPTASGPISAIGPTAAATPFAAAVTPSPDSIAEVERIIALAIAAGFTPPSPTMKRQIVWATAEWMDTTPWINSLTPVSPPSTGLYAAGDVEGLDTSRPSTVARAGASTSPLGAQIPTIKVTPATPPTPATAAKVTRSAPPATRLTPEEV